MDYSYTTSTSTSSGSLEGPALVTALLLYVALILLVAVPSLITNWRLYKKAGHPGWTSIVPIYNVMVEIEIAKQPMWYLALLFVPVVNIVVSIMILIEFTKQYTQNLGFWLAYIFLPIVAVFMVSKVDYIGGEATEQYVPTDSTFPVNIPTNSSVAATPPEQPPAPAQETPVQGFTPTESFGASVTTDDPMDEPSPAADDDASKQPPSNPVA